MSLRDRLSDVAALRRRLHGMELRQLREARLDRRGAGVLQQRFVDGGDRAVRFVVAALDASARDDDLLELVAAVGGLRLEHRHDERGAGDGEKRSANARLDGSHVSYPQIDG